MQKILTILITLTMASCSLLDHRDFERVMGSDFEQGGDMFTPGEDFAVTPGDGGQYYRGEDEILARTPANSYRREEMEYYNSMRSELRQLVQKLNDEDYRIYNKYSDYLPTVSKKIYFLKLPPYERVRYLNDLGVQVTEVRNSYNPHSISSRITIGMTKGDVSRSLGLPQSKATAIEGEAYERWSYTKKGAVSHVYFANGTVTSWQ